MGLYGDMVVTNRPAFIFPGQGSQYVGMSKSFYDGYRVARDVFDEADEVLGFGLSVLAFNGPGDELDRTENTQPALLAASVAALRVLEESLELTPVCMAGHSLGEYTALVAAGAMSFRDAVRLVHLRGKFMQDGVEAGEGGMCAVLGLDAESVFGICSEATRDGSIVVPANINSPAQVVVSGHAAAVKRAAALSRERGAKRVVELKVSAPSHSPLMAGAAARLNHILERVELKDLNVPVYSNVEAEPIGDVSRVRDLLTRQLTSPVLWVDTIKSMKRDGVGAVVEIGPGKVLSSLVKRIDKTIDTFNLDSAADIDDLVKALEGVR
jgi:[acyl-carrier-protein] S-malonyltransferase